MKMYLEHRSVDQICKTLRVTKVIVEKWITSFNMHHTADPNCEMIYEIIDDSSESNDAYEPGITVNESGGLAALRWSESSESDDAKSLKDNAPPTDNHSTASDNKPDDQNISVQTPTRQLRPNHKRFNLMVWKEVPCRCMVCNEKFVGVNDLRLHVREQHHKPYADSEDKNYGCGLCFKAFDLFGKLVHHSITAHVSHLRLR